MLSLEIYLFLKVISCVTLFLISLLNFTFLHFISYAERDIYALKELVDTEVCRKYKADIQIQTSLNVIRRHRAEILSVIGVRS